MVSPIIHELAEEYEDRIVTGEVNVDENPKVTMTYKVRNIPTVLFFKNGEVVDKQVGAVPKSTFKNLVEKYI
jgi:thioredoxin 1